MAMITAEPIAVQVRTDWFDGRPREVTLAGERMRVTAVCRVRQEDRAYNVAVGPRTVFEVSTRGARLSLIYRHRSRRWTVERIDESLLPVMAPTTSA